MKRRQITLFLSSLFFTLLLSIGLKALSPPPAIAQPSSLLIGAASGLEAALKEIDFLFKAANTGVAVNYNFATSASLQQQIEQGTSVDVFISDASKQMNALQQKSLILPGTRQTLLTNRLVLIVPGSSKTQINSFRQLTNSTIKRIAMGDPRSVPAGQYAKEVLENLGIWGQIQSKLAFSSSIQGVLGAVESGNADAGLVYETDAKSSTQVKQVATAPTNAHSPIVYSVAVMRTSRNQETARTYAQFLQSSDAQTVFKNYGFERAE